jgi:hypothetical protein
MPVLELAQAGKCEETRDEDDMMTHRARDKPSSYEGNVGTAAAYATGFRVGSFTASDGCE